MKAVLLIVQYSYCFAAVGENHEASRTGYKPAQSAWHSGSDGVVLFDSNRQYSSVYFILTIRVSGVRSDLGLRERNSPKQTPKGTAKIAQTKTKGNSETRPNIVERDQQTSKTPLG